MGVGLGNLWVVGRNKKKPVLYGLAFGANQPALTVLRRLVLVFVFVLVLWIVSIVPSLLILLTIVGRPRLGTRNILVAIVGCGCRTVLVLGVRMPSLMCVLR